MRRPFRVDPPTDLWRHAACRRVRRGLDPACGV